MTQAMWLFEYHALLERDRTCRTLVNDLFKSATTILREVLVGVLGLNLIKAWKAPKGEAFDEKTKAVLEGMTPFVPGAFIFGRPEMVNHYLDEMKLDAKTEAEATAYASNQDEAFEEFSARLARGEAGDMDPVFVGVPGEEVNRYWRSEEAKATVAALGVKPRPKSAPAVPHVRMRIERPDTGTTGAEGHD